MYNWKKNGNFVENENKQKFQNVFRQLKSFFAFVASTIFQVSTVKKNKNKNRKTKKRGQSHISYKLYN